MILALLFTLCQSDVTVTIPMTANIRGTEVELGEVAKVTGANAEQVARVKALELGYAPAPGYTRVIVTERVREKLYQKLPEIRVSVTGERACRLLPTVTPVSKEEIRITARKALVDKFGVQGTTIQLAGEIPEVRIPAGSGPPGFVARPNPSELASGLVSVPVDLVVDGMRYRTLWTTWRVEVYEVRSVLTQPVKKGQQLSPSMFMQKRVQVPAGRQVLPLKRTMLLGAVAKRDLHAGDLVSPFDVHRPTVVAIGEPLLLHVRKGSISAQISVQALEAGAIGDRIGVRTQSTDRELIVTVRSRDYCELILR